MKQIRVLNDGFVRLIDHMGDDQRVVEAARVSYKGGRRKRSDERLIRYLMEHGHMSPFEHVEFEFYVRAPVFVARQWFRHRTGQPNEVSLRYRPFDETGGLWRPDWWRLQDTKNKQGSKGVLPEDGQALANALLESAYAKAVEVYEQLINMGVAREQARAVLPLGIYTEFYWKQNLRNLFNLLAQRLHPHAQPETRAYARAVLEFVRQVAPVSTEAWMEKVGVMEWL